MEDPPPAQAPARPRSRVALKQNLNRSVFLERVESGMAVIKRFHGAGRLHRLFDRRRAAGERRALDLARAAGLPVPRVLELRRREGYWELATEHLEGAVSLREILDDRAPWPVPAQRLVRTLAELHARAVSAGLDHEDLHAGNVLIDESGGAWLVDLAHARLGTAPAPDRLRDQLVRLGADVREDLAPPLRARYLAALLRRIDPALRAGLGSPGELARSLEVQARDRRRKDLERGTARWLRTSSVARAVRERLEDGSELVAVLRRGLTSQELQAWLAALEQERPPRLDLPRARYLLHHADQGRDLREAWSTAARLAMHGVPCATPAALVTRPRCVALFELEPNSCPAEDMEDRALPWRRRAAKALGRLLGTLHERGLALAEPGIAHVWFSEEAEVARFGPGVGLRVLDDEREARERQALGECLRGPMEEALFEAAYARYRHVGGASSPGP